MAPAEQDEIRESRQPSLGPVMHVMGLAAAYLAAGEATGPIAMAQSPAERRRDGARPGPDLHGPTVLIVPHHYPARIAHKAPRRSRGNVAHLLPLGLAGRLRVRQHGGVDMDDHLVPLARRAGVELVVQGALGEQPQRIGVLLRPGRRRKVGIGVALPLIQRLPRRIERAQEQGPRLEVQPAAKHERAVVVPIDVQSSAGVLHRQTGLRTSVQLSPAPDDSLHMDGRARASHREQTSLGLRCGDAGQSPGLGIGELPARKGVGETR